MPPTPPSPITRPLYRTLLRTARNFRHDPVLTSLLHRTGRSDRWDPTEGPYHRGGPPTLSSDDDDDDIPPEELRSVHLPPENAMDLTRGYDELRRVQYRRTRAVRPSGGGEAAVFGTEEALLEAYVMAKFEGSGGAARRPAHEVLFRRLVKDVMGSGEARMRFPSDIVTSGHLGRLEEVLRREFRAPSLGDWDGAATASLADGDDDGGGGGPLVSSYFADDVRREAGFLALRELGKKVAWAGSLGVEELGGGAASSSGVGSSSSVGVGVGAEEGAAAISHDETATAPQHGSTGTNSSKDREGVWTANPRQQQRRRHPNQAARDVSPLPTAPPSSYLRPGSYLVAHPLLPGYFARTVIAILEHTDGGGPSGGAEGGDDDDDDDGDDGDPKDDDSDSASLSGGTYGLIVNRESYASLPGGSGDRRRPRALREVVRPDCLPPALRRAFGDLAVREGGPVNVAVQMLHAGSPEGEERLRIGGAVLPMILEEAEGEGRGEREERDGDGSSCEEGDGSDKAGGEEDAKGETTVTTKSAALDTDSAIYFGGDLMKAARAVLDDNMDRDDFTFIVGASVWSVGQLESEIERGYWLPCRGPPHMALTGMCEHVDAERSAADGDEKGGSGSGERGKGPPSRPKSDLWLSMMCAIGEEEARLAHLMLDEEYDENGEACDDF